MEAISLVDCFKIAFVNIPDLLRKAAQLSCVLTGLESKTSSKYLTSERLKHN